MEGSKLYIVKGISKYLASGLHLPYNLAIPLVYPPSNLWGQPFGVSFAR